MIKFEILCIKSLQSQKFKDFLQRTVSKQVLSVKRKLMSTDTQTLITMCVSGGTIKGVV